MCQNLRPHWHKRRMLMTLNQIKQKPLENRIPIIMNDTLEKLEELLKQEKPKSY